MSFISMEYVLLFVLTFLVFYLSPQRFRKPCLLLASCIFIGYYHWMFLVAALVVALFTYGAGIAISRALQGRHYSLVFWSAVTVLVLTWLGARYAAEWTGDHSLIFPLGMSFYTFQALSYLTDVYWEEQRAERNVVYFLLYMLLFMKFLSGPIERSGSLLPQLKTLKPASYEDMTYGLKLIIVGLIMKIVLSDSISPYIDNVFNHYQSASGLQLLMACLLYPIDMYGDFGGYTNIAIGCAAMFGLRLSPNFNRPFISTSTADFWRRWHISLSSWVRDYLYLPLAGTFRQWGRWGISLSLIITFVVLGIWHGAGWNFVVYGLIQGLVIIFEQNTSTLRKTVRERVGNGIATTYSILRTYIIFALSLVFFKCPSLSSAWYFISHISLQAHDSWKEMNLGMQDHTAIVAGVAFVLVMVYEFFTDRRDLFQLLAKRPTWQRWAVYYMLVVALFIYGKYGEDTFIYLQF